MTTNSDSEVAKHGARAPCYLLFDNQGSSLGALTNPYARVDRGAAPRVATLLADKGVTLLAAGDFGPRFVTELERRDIEIVLRTGSIAGIVRQLID